MRSFDVVVVGAGPAGSSAALFAARGGAKTLLVDRREEIGQPVQCGEFLPTLPELETLFPNHEGFEEVYQIPPEAVLRETREMLCVDPRGRGYPFSVEGVSVSRRSFDKVLALRAEGEGAELQHPVSVTRIVGDEVHLASGESVRARTVVAADGPLSLVGRALGFPPPSQMYRMVTGTSAGAFPSRVELFFGSLAPGGYAWVIPKEGEANVGLGATELPPGKTLSTLLRDFLSRRGLPMATDLTRWWVPLGPPPDSAIRGRALFCGDAAHLVMATNGGGIPTAMISGMDAGKVAARHTREGVPLSLYDQLWRRHLYLPLERAWRLKRLGDRLASRDRWLALGMWYLGPGGLDAMIRLRWPRRLLGRAA